MSNSIAAVAQSGFTNASAYDAHRPDYPRESMERLLNELGILYVTGARVLDIGAGTGKFTALLADRPENFDIIAVEPHADMRNILNSKHLDGVTVLEGYADSMPLVRTGWADAAICSQSFHWFANKNALKEIHRTMGPGRVMGLVWNIDDYNSPKDWKATTEWEQNLKDLLASTGDSNPRFRNLEWLKVFDKQVKSGPIQLIMPSDPLFSLPLGEHSVRWTHWLSKEGLWDRFCTLSNIANLEGEALEETRRKAFAVMDRSDVETNEKGEVAAHGQTVSYWTTAIPNTPLMSPTGGGWS